MKKPIPLSVTLVLIVSLIGSFYIFHQKTFTGSSEFLSRCINYNPEWLGVVNCYGVISIWEPHNSGYLVVNNKEPGSIVAQIKTANSFFTQGNEIYLIDITPSGICDNLMPDKYCGNFQVNGIQKVYYFDSPEEVPKYLIINIETGNEDFYVNPQEASSSAQTIFKELQAI